MLACGVWGPTGTRMCAPSSRWRGQKFFESVPGNTPSFILESFLIFVYCIILIFRNINTFFEKLVSGAQNLPECSFLYKYYIDKAIYKFSFVFIFDLLCNEQTLCDLCDSHSSAHEHTMHSHRELVFYARWQLTPRSKLNLVESRKHWVVCRSWYTRIYTRPAVNGWHSVLMHKCPPLFLCDVGVCSDAHKQQLISNNCQHNSTAVCTQLGSFFAAVPLLAHEVSLQRINVQFACPEGIGLSSNRKLYIGAFVAK